MNIKPIIVNCIINNEERHIILSPAYPGSSIYEISIDKLNQGEARKITKEWSVYLNENSLLNEQHKSSILNALTNAELLNNQSRKEH